MKDGIGWLVRGHHGNHDPTTGTEYERTMSCSNGRKKSKKGP